MLHRKTPAPPTGWILRSHTKSVPPVPASPAQTSIGITPQPISSQTTTLTAPSCNPFRTTCTGSASLFINRRTSICSRTKQEGKRLCPNCTPRRQKSPNPKSPVLTIVLFFRCGSHLQLTFLPFQHSSKGADRQNCQLRHLQKKSRRSPVIPPNCFLHRCQKTIKIRLMPISTAAPAHQKRQISKPPANAR